jgi:hypothetical protein
LETVCCGGAGEKYGNAINRNLQLKFMCGFVHVTWKAKLSFKLVQISSEFIDVALTIIAFAFITPPTLFHARL